MKLQRCWLHSFIGTPARPNHIAYLCSRGFTHLPPTCNSKLFGYNFTNCCLYKPHTIQVLLINESRRIIIHFA
ncbi:hypothetical protein CRN52_07425 [Vibrio vulnificus]|uniref:Uncharacterized protein n=1 Tax=Vibrio vulnificus TaxID=672 RepID=A0A2S3R538_VIBVL|nr:hypothetical protein CRN52_07425 [Vibrio vulnificus]